MALFEKALKDILVAQAFTDTAGSPLTWFLAMEEDTPDFAAVLLPDPGTSPFRTITEFPSFTIRVRHLDGLEAMTAMRRIFQYLHERSFVQGSSAGVPPVARITATSGPVQVGRDSATARGRWVIQQNFTAILQQVDQLV